MSKKMQYVIIGIMCFILTIGIVVQIKTVNNNGTTVGVKQEESELKTQVLKMKEKYENSYEKLQKTESELEKTRENATNNNEELKNLEKQIKEANVLLGLTDVKGTGASITLADGVASSSTLKVEDLLIHNTDLLNVVNELKNAGAEAIEINGKRIVGTTAINCDGHVITVNGEKVTSPFTINAIGYPELLSTLNRAGGYLSILGDYNVKTEFKKRDKISIPKYTGIMSFKYAKSVL